MTAYALNIEQPNEASNEVVPSESVSKADKQEKPATEPQKQPESKSEPVWVTNPQNCNLNTQWVYEDGSCHDKVVENVVSVARSEATPQPVSKDCYYDLLSQYDWDVATMQRIMRAESGCNPTNHNWSDNHGSCLGSYGLLQIGCIHGKSVDYLSIPENNIQTAYIIYLRQGYGAWGVCNTMVSC